MADNNGIDFLVVSNPNPFQQSYDNFLKRAIEDKEVRATLCTIRSELIQISWSDRRRGDNRQSFLAPEVLDRVRELGQQLLALGGEGAMQIAHESIREEVAHPADLRLLEFAWDGIGMWRC